MKRFALYDIKSKKQPEKINLKTTASSAVLSKPKIKLHPNNPRKTDLSQLSRRAARKKDFFRPIFTVSRRKNLDSIYSDQKPEKFHLVPEERTSSKVIRSIWSIFQFGLAGFLIIMLINLVNVFQSAKQLKSTVVSRASSGVENLLDAAKKANENLTASKEQFALAQEDFNYSLEKISFLSAKSPQSAQASLDSIEKILAAGKLLSESGQLFSKSAQNLQEWPSLFIQNNQNFFKNSQGKATLQVGQVNESISLTDQLKIDLDNVDQAIKKLLEASLLLKSADPAVLPAEYALELQKIQSRLDALVDFLNQVRGHIPAVLELLGDRYPHRYLILLQNDTEIRPTGGFIGSLMIMDLNDGLITRADFHDVYKFDGQLYESIPAPEDIASITDNWRLRDSNFSPDFKVSAEKAAWFLQKSKGPSVDTVIAVNQSIIADFLDSIGPLEVDGLKQPLDSSNFQFMLSFLIESKHYGASNPKIILEKTINSFRQQMLKIENPEELLQILIKGALDQKIMLYSRDIEVQALFDDLQLTPHQQAVSENSDYLQVVATSIGGNKSDLYITQNVVHQTYVNTDGELINEVTISRKHNWTIAELNRWNILVKEFGFKEVPGHLQDLLGRGTNKASIKLYVPLGSELIGSAGLPQAEIQTRSDIDLGRTYFRFEQTVEAGLEKSVTVRYRLPFKLNLLSAEIYRFAADKQLGLINTVFKKEIILSPGLKEIRSSLNPASRQFKLKQPFQFISLIEG